MKRENKFRGIEVGTNGRWIYGFYEVQGDKHYICFWATDNRGASGMCRVLVKPETVGQYTGLKDNFNLTELYEGDILDANGVLIGNKYANEDLLQDPVNFVIEGLCTKNWCNTYKEAVRRGCKDA